MQKRKVVFVKDQEELVIPTGLGPGELKTSTMRNHGFNAPYRTEARIPTGNVRTVAIPRHEVGTTTQTSGYIPLPPPSLPPPSLSSIPTGAPFTSNQASNAHLFLNTIRVPDPIPKKSEDINTSPPPGSNAHLFLQAPQPLLPSIVPITTQEKVVSEVKAVVIPKEKEEVAAPERKGSSLVEMPKRSKPRSYLGIQMPSKAAPVAAEVKQPTEEKITKAESPPIDPSTVVILPQISDLDRMTDAQFQEFFASLKLKPKSQKLRECFQSIALSYMKGVYLQIGNIRCEVIEVEFFYYPDPYVGLNSFFPNGFDDQLLTTRHFYLHREYNHQTGYATVSTGDKRGLYITLGNPSCPGAMLIRSLRRLDVQKADSPKTTSGLVELQKRIDRSDIVESSQTVIDFILDTLDFSVDDLDAYFTTTAVQKGFQTRTLPLDAVQDDLTAKICFRTAPNSNTEIKIYSAPRLHLGLRVPAFDPSLVYIQISQPFRYVSAPADLQEGKTLLALQAQLDLVPDETIKSELKVSGESLGRWKGMFLKGQTMCLDRFLSQDHSNLEDIKNQIYAFGFFSQFVDVLP